MSVLVIEAKQMLLSSGRRIEIAGFDEDTALRVAQTLLEPFLRTTGGDISITWKPE